MRAWTYRSFGPPSVLTIAELSEPTITSDQIEVAVKAVALNVIDSRIRNGTMGILVNKKFPKISACDFAGIVKSTGAGVSGFQAGDRVFGALNPLKGGALAETIAVDQEFLTAIPPSLDFDEAAALPVSSLAALIALRDLGHVTSGQKVLIHGSSGGTGLMAIQLAKHFGAKVIAVCGTSGVDASREAGADVVLDYKHGPLKLPAPFDSIVNFSGAMPFAEGKALLTPTGSLIEPSPTVPVFLGSKLANLFRAQKHLMLETLATKVNLDFIASLAVNGTLRPTISAKFPFSNAVSAFEALEKRGTIGKLVISYA
jgi:NADPH:quinone reductase-like Zn-dependent oxidoreductase